MTNFTRYIFSTFHRLPLVDHDNSLFFRNDTCTSILFANLASNYFFVRFIVWERKATCSNSIEATRFIYTTTTISTDSAFNLNFSTSNFICCRKNWYWRTLGRRTKFALQYLTINVNKFKNFFCLNILKNIIPNPRQQ